MNQRRMNSGFTLGELLVVMAIIVVLAAILFPVFARQRDREQAQEGTCFHHMQEIGYAMLEYSADNDTYFPDGANENGLGSGWAGQIYPYINKVSVFVCPSDPTVPSKDAHFSSYGYNRQAAKYSPDGSGPGSYSLIDFTDPGKTVLCFELQSSNYYAIDHPDGERYVNGDEQYDGGSASGTGIGGEYDLVGYNTDFGTTSSPTTVKYATGYLRNMETGSRAQSDFTGATGRHSGGANYTLADGHVAFLLPSNVSGGYPNEASSGTDCGHSDLSVPEASQTGCPDKTITATFNRT